MDEEDDHECECEPGAPLWMSTFADLSTLLMSFFVLLLAFSEMDINKFKELAGEIKNAFGVQADVETRIMPRGTSIIAREFRPGKPEPTPIKSVRQFTIQTNKNSLKWLEKQGADFEDVAKVVEALEEQLKDGELELEWDRDTITIHIQEKASFDSGSADLKQDFVPVIHRIRDLLAELSGQISIEGHTDNVPIATARFRSNWELSASRAVSVTQEMLGNKVLEPERFLVIGHADTDPVESNDSREGRAANRRVDVLIDRNKDAEDDMSEVVERLGSVVGKVEGGLMTLTLPTDEPLPEGEAAEPILINDVRELAPFLQRRAAPDRVNVPQAPAGPAPTAVYDEDI
ncbi:MAG: flagellar motor protein MotB [Pseudomonadota bacterium]